MRRLLLVALLVVGCHRDPPVHEAEEDAALVAPVTSAPVPAAAACLPRITKHGALAHVEALGGKACLCYAGREGDRDAEPTEVACLAVDLTSGSVSAAPRWALAAGDVAKAPAVSGDGSRTFAFATERDGVFGDTTDTKTHKRLFHVKLSRGSSFTNPKNTWTARWFGSGVVLTEKLCCDPEGTTLLLDPEHGTTKHLHGFAGTHGAIDETTLFAVDRRKLFFVDIANQRTIAGPFTAPGPPFPDPELLNADAVIVGNTLVFAYANPPGYLSVDVGTRAWTRASAPVALPLCAAPAAAE